MDEGFKIVCLHCGGSNIDISEDIDYNYEEEPYLNGGELWVCKDCGNSEIR